VILLMILTSQCTDCSSKGYCYLNKKTRSWKEKKNKSRTLGLKRLRKVGSARRVESSDASLGAQENASKQGRKNADIDQDAEVTLIDETQGKESDDRANFYHHVF
ncbi:hypothetical protein Tco_0047594, partial [Tanacetum coccineum]